MTSSSWPPKTLVAGHRLYESQQAGLAQVASQLNEDYNSHMSAPVTHDRSDETIEQKARWFQSLPLAERMEMLCSFTDLALEVNPSLKESESAEPPAGRVQIISTA